MVARPLYEILNKIFYKIKFFEKLVLELKLNSKSIRNGIKLFWIHLSTSKLILK